MIADDRKVRRLVPGWRATIPCSRGAEEILAWHDADPARQRVDAGRDAPTDRMVAHYA